MTRYEYKVIPVPAAPPRIKGVRSRSERYVMGLETAMNEMGAKGWDYVRSDRHAVTAPRGLLRRAEIHEEAVLVFRRALPDPVAPASAHMRVDPPEPAPEQVSEPVVDVPADGPRRGLFASRPLAEPARTGITATRED